MKNEQNFTFPSLILSAGLIISVIIFSLVWSAARNADQTITVTGSAKIEFVSDLAQLEVVVEVRSFDSKIAFRTIQSQIPEVIKFIEENISEQSTTDLSTINSYPLYRLNNQGYSTNEVSMYVYNQTVKIESNNMEAIKELSLKVSSLVEKGISVRVQEPRFFYTKLDELKIEAQALAATNAMERAERVANATGRTLGPLRSARMGVIQITPRNSTIISDYGMNDTSAIEKEITAVVSASFEIN
ncbi:MAG: SIMPL domain-containing protein [Melioribacteraceae bacterium]|nr:SIMPL domain-containing protein [Melioribacteraceae bacterium]MCF8265117.1 SIMPL domain-containing protein [Melioribacteraceae bacterium]MCF8413590.1 SIMPL domain-containing protein [Melioribacteraceae bacterium]